jgi:thiol-disulfide isomerase/thioredoxin
MSTAAKVFNFLKPILTVAVIFILLQVTGLIGGVSYVTQSAAMKTGLLDADASNTEDPIPFDFNFSVKDLQGSKIPFDQFKGKVIFLNLWATWCGPCRAEMPTIQKLYNEVPNDKIVFVMLSLDKDQDKDKIVQYIKSKSFSFPVYQPSGYLTEQMNVPSIPTTFVISKEGKIVSMEVGTTNFNTSKFKKFITGLAAQ